MARRATRFELSGSVVGPQQRLAARQRTQRRTSATADNAYEAMMQAYVRTARELREARETSRAQEALNARRSTRLRRCWPTATASTSSSTTSSPTP
jgi:hypothetical protein